MHLATQTESGRGFGACTIEVAKQDAVLYSVSWVVPTGMLAAIDQQGGVGREEDMPAAAGCPIGSMDPTISD